MYCCCSLPSLLVPKTQRDAFYVNCNAYYSREYKRKVQENVYNNVNITCDYILTNIHTLYSRTRSNTFLCTYVGT
jgi:hypothetical protein